MSKIVDRRPTRADDELRAILSRISGLATKPHGVKVAGPGEGVLFETVLDEPRWMDGAWVVDAEEQITVAAEDLAVAATALDVAYDDLLIAGERIADAGERLDAADSDAAADALELAEMVELLGDHAVILDEGQEALDAALQDGLSTMAQRYDETAARLGAIDTDLSATKGRLESAEYDIRDALPRVGAVEDLVDGLGGKATAAENAAAEALRVAQETAQQLEGLDPSAGEDSYTAAMNAAQEAAAAAAEAMKLAGQAQESADGKATIRNATTTPRGVGTAIGDTWMQWTSFPNGSIIGQWTWDGKTWCAVKISHQVLASVDLGKATVGLLNGLRIAAGSVAADRLTIGIGDNALPDPSFTSASMNDARRAQSSAGGVLSAEAGEPVWTWQDVAGSIIFRLTLTGRDGAAPTTPGEQWRVSVPVNPGTGNARLNVHWWRADGTITYTAGSSYITGDTRQTLAATVTAPATTAGAAPVVGVSFSVYSTTQTARTLRVYSGASARPMKDGSLIVNGTIAGRHLQAEDVAATIGQFVKVKATNVEVTSSLAAQIVQAMSTTTKNLVVTESAVMQHLTALSAEVLGTFKANKIHANDILVPGSVTAATVLVTGELAANVFSAATLAATKAFVETKLIVGESFQVLGTAIVNDINIRGTLRGRDAILDGTLDVEQLNVTQDMAAQIVSAMTVNTKKLVVTEAAIMQHVTAIKGIVTPDLTALEARIGTLLAGKASIADLAAGDITLTGHFRSGGEGQPGVVIPRNYTTIQDQEQLGVWLSPTGLAPSLGAEWGQIAGLWLDRASNVTGSANQSPLRIRGQSGAGVHLYGEVRVSPKTGINLAVIKGAGTNMQIEGDNGRDVTAYADQGGGARLYVSNGSGDATVQANGSGAARLWASGSGDARVVSTGTGNVRIYSEGKGNVDVDAAGVADIRGASDANLKAGNVVNIRSGLGTVSETGGFVALRNLAGDAYGKGTPSSGSWVSLFMDVNNGRVYRSTSARRYKAHIEEFVPDPSWLDMPVVTYVDAKDPENGRPQIGTIAEDALEHGAEPLVMWSSEGAEDYRYEREVPVLRWFLREHRDEIAALKDRIEQQDKTITALAARLDALEAA